MRALALIKKLILFEASWETKGFFIWGLNRIEQN